MSEYYDPVRIDLRAFLQEGEGKMGIGQQIRSSGSFRLPAIVASAAPAIAGLPCMIISWVVIGVFSWLIHPARDDDSAYGT
ncbi:MAG: hypothetical protein A3J97_00905 [Spirochaetes bacterium RIFOXYC1_FULL_54_7]|nr:MAG: hypothetical protein A3J97_00905 [Spirochaetes bacterium RIFOXYC1_FULL_54_7]